MPRMGLVAVLTAGALTGAVGSAAAAPARPDLVVAALSSPPERAVPREQFQAADTVANRGRPRARASVTRYYVAAAGVWHTVGRREVPALRGGASSRGAVWLTLPASLPDGTFRLIACADAHGDVRESRERNNCTVATTRVTVDTTSPPAPVIDDHPDVTTISDRAHFAFSGPEADVRFTCALDEQEPAPCESPRAYESLDAGAIAFA